MSDITKIILELRVTISWCNRFAQLIDPKNSLRKSEDFLNKRDEFSGLYFRDLDSLIGIIRDLSDYRRHHTSIDNKAFYSGEILVYHPNESTCDGSATIESNDLFGECDNPPADTWFYVHDSRIKGISVLCWIPNIFTNYAQDIIDICAPAGIVSWLKDEDNQLYEEIKKSWFS